MNVKLLAAVMITGLVLSGSSAYLNKVFADDQWSNIVQRQLLSEQKATMVYSDMYMFNNAKASLRDWSGLTSTTTDENTKGRDITGASQTSMQNAISEFDRIHALQLTSTQNTGYAGLNSITTDEQGRNRSAMIAQAMNDSVTNAQYIVSELSKIDQTYTNLQNGGTTQATHIDRQGHIVTTWDAMEEQATELVNALTKIDSDYLSLKYAGTTNEQTTGRHLEAAQINSLEKAIQIFEEIHAKNLAITQSNGYAGLSSTTTNEQNPDDRSIQIELGTQYALQNALDTYNSYYNSAGLNQTLYAH